MAKLPGFRRVYHTDYPKEFQGLVEKMSVSINNGFEVLYDALNNKVDLANNVACLVKEVDVQVNSGGLPLSTTTFNISSTRTVSGLEVIKVTNLTNSSVYPTGAPFCSFTQDNNIITVNHVTGIQANNLYRLKIVAYYD
jgi:hypothetical protein